MYEHWWFTVDHGEAIKCDKCGKYVEVYLSDFDEIEYTKDCPESDKEME